MPTIDIQVIIDPSFHRPSEEHLYPMGSRSPETERQMQSELLAVWVRRQREGWAFLRRQMENER